MVIHAPVFYYPEAAQYRVTVAKQVRTGRIISTVFSWLITAAIWWFLRDFLGELTWWIVALVIGLPLVGLVWSIIKVRLMTIDAARAPGGLAVGVGRDGLVLGATQLSWPDVGLIAARPRRFGRSDDLVIIDRAGRQIVFPLDYLDMRPAQLDNILRTMSGGRARIDFAALDL